MPTSQTNLGYPLQAQNIPEDADFAEILQAFNQVLKPPRDSWIKFTLHIDAPANSKDRNGGAATIFLKTEAEAKRLAIRVAKQDIVIKRNKIYLKRIDGPLARAIHVPFRAPRISDKALANKQITQSALAHDIRIVTVQFGIVGRDDTTFSAEWTGNYDPNAPTIPGNRDLKKPDQWAYLKFNDGREGENPRALQVEIGSLSAIEMYRISIPMSSIKAIQNAWDYGQPYVILTLYHPPSFETKDANTPSTGDVVKDRRLAWRRIGALDARQERVVAFTSKVVRLVLTNHDQHLNEFIKMSRFVGLPPLKQSNHANIISLGIFSRKYLDPVDAFLDLLPWTVAFQCEALLRNYLLDPTEILALQPEIQRLVDIGHLFAEEVLKLFIVLVPNIAVSGETIRECLLRAEAECNEKGKTRSPRSGTFRARHVTVTPTSFQLEGPYNEQSNRVLRKYGPQYEEYFMRVLFTEEGGTQYRFDYEVDNQKFVEERVGAVLKHGILIRGRMFEFLAYSSSGLRQHSVWFVAAFKHHKYGHLDAAIIRDDLGDFAKVRNCPARYGARLSQAFSSTDPSIRVTKSEKVDDVADIITERRSGSDDEPPVKLLWTDGVGSISPALARAMWDELVKDRPDKCAEDPPAAYQIRIGGYKGMVSVDNRLSGRKILLRESMNKYDDKNGFDIEVSDAFDNPSYMYLNRPLIMLLDTLGIPASAFVELQDRALHEVQDALTCASSSAHLMKTWGLGKAYNLPKILDRLERCGLQQLHSDPFIRRLLSHTLYHVKREIKYHARIPVPDSWTLVGVADVHDQLESDEYIMACVKEKGKPPGWLEGPILISRSPTVHPGDVQMVTAVKPAIGTPYDKLPLTNCVIFAVKGKRPLPECLGGGDLDGDLYNLITLPSLHPMQCHKPAAYEKLPQMKLNRDSTINDVADFVVQYINSNTLGLIGTNHLQLADQRPEGVRDKDCLDLAELHSRAVDYPKTGVPVDWVEVARRKPPMKPDWYASESVDPDNGDYYESYRALGVLFRNIRLDPQTTVAEAVPASQPPQKVLVRTALEGRITSLLERRHPQPPKIEHFERIFHRYLYELKYQCVTHKLSSNPNGRLAEEEVIIGTILGKTTALSESRKRKNLMDRLSSQSEELVRSVKMEIEGSSSDLEARLANAWKGLGTAYNLVDKRKFGAKGFALIALSSVLDVLEELEGR